MRAVHVHLSVSQTVEPGPGEESVPTRRVAWDSKLVLLRQGTAPDERLDSFEGLSRVI